MKESDQNSYKDLIGKEKNVKKRTKIRKKKMKTMSILKISDEIEIKDEKKTKFSKFSLGKIEYAKIHKQANRPLKKLPDLTEEEIKKYSCPCCGLPSQISGKLEPYKIFDNSDEFVNCGQGVVLYFSFFKFAIVVTFIATIGISFLDSFISYNYNYELRKICDNLYANNDIKKLEYIYAKIYAEILYYFDLDSIDDYSIDDYSIDEECKFYSNNYTINNTLFNSFFFKISVVSIKYYRRLYYAMEKIRYNNIEDIVNNLMDRILYKNITKTNKEFESTIINLSFTNFLCMINIFIFYLFFIFFLYNKSNVASYLVCTISDYAILLTNLNDLYKLFKNNLEDIMNKEVECNKKKTKNTEKKNI